MPKYIYCTKQNCVGRVGDVCQWYNCPFGGRILSADTSKPLKPVIAKTDAPKQYGWSDENKKKLKQAVEESNMDWCDIGNLFQGKTLEAVQRQVYRTYGKIALKEIREEL